MKNTDEMSNELQHLSTVSDDDIDTSDIPEVTNFSLAEKGRFFRPIKKQVTLRLDMDLIEFFKEQGTGYQTRINSALRAFVEDHRKVGHG